MSNTQRDAEREVTGTEEFDLMTSVESNKAEAGCWVNAYKLASKFWKYLILEWRRALLCCSGR